MRANWFVMGSRPLLQPSLFMTQVRPFTMRQRVKKTLIREVKQTASIEEYFEKLMRRRRENSTGFINLPRRNFEDVLNKHVKTETDYQQLLAAFYNYQGHKNTFPQTSTDALLSKAI